MITQVVKADDAGVFTYCAPRAGWWGFAALNTADYRLQAPDGTMKDVEVGGVLWVEFMDWKER
jgi:cobalt/nickel transport protein